MRITVVFNFKNQISESLVPHSQTYKRHLGGAEPLVYFVLFSVFQMSLSCAICGGTKTQKYLVFQVKLFCLSLHLQVSSPGQLHCWVWAALYGGLSDELGMGCSAKLSTPKVLKMSLLACRNEVPAPLLTDREVTDGV